MLVRLLKPPRIQHLKPEGQRWQAADALPYHGLQVSRRYAGFDADGLNRVEALAEQADGFGYAKARPSTGLVIVCPRSHTPRGRAFLDILRRVLFV